MRNIQFVLAGIGFLFLTACTSVYHLPVEKTPESLKESTMNGQSVVVSFHDSLWRLDSVRVNGDTVQGNSRLLLEPILEVDPTTAMFGSGYSTEYKYRIVKFVAATNKELLPGQVLLYVKNNAALFSDTLFHPATFDLKRDIDSSRVQKISAEKTTGLVIGLTLCFVLFSAAFSALDSGWGGMGIF